MNSNQKFSVSVDGTFLSKTMSLKCEVIGSEHWKTETYSLRSRRSQGKKSGEKNWEKIKKDSAFLHLFSKHDIHTDLKYLTSSGRDDNVHDLVGRHQVGFRCDVRRWCKQSNNVVWIAVWICFPRCKVLQWSTKFERNFKENGEH